MWKRLVPGAPALLALLVVAFVGCGGDSDDETSTGAKGEPSGFEITGSWKGQLQQKGLKPFEVTATIGDLQDPAKNTVHYTGIDCGGNWTYLGREGKTYRFREVIDRGAGGDCKGQGEVRLTPFEPVGVDYEFRGGGVESYGVLKRQ
jgi:hypothetical protein